MVLTEEIENGEVIFYGKKKYKRIILNGTVEWRRFKTNHQVTKEQHEHLEKEYSKNHSKKNVVVFRKNPLDIKNDSQRIFLENNLVAASDNGKALLAGVKRVKELTGWGLKDSKEYVEAFFERKEKFNNTDNLMTKEEVVPKLEKLMKKGENKLECVKYVKRISGWTLLESKNFYESYIKFKEAKELVKRGF